MVLVEQHVFFFILEALQNPEELRGVLAQEIIVFLHILAKHHILGDSLHVLQWKITLFGYPPLGIVDDQRAKEIGNQENEFVQVVVQGVELPDVHEIELQLFLP